MRHLSEIICDHDPLLMPQTATVKAACRLMGERMTEAVLVTDETGHLAGIFTEHDAVCAVLAAGRSASKTTLSQVMTPNPVTMSPDNTAIEALRMMWDCGFRHLPLVRGETLLGVISRADFAGDERTRLEQERDLWEHIR
jgi:CBS domain-containing protein